MSRVLATQTIDEYFNTLKETEPQIKDEQNEIKEWIEYFYTNYGLEHFNGIIERHGIEAIIAAIELGIEPENFDECYLGKFDNDREFARCLTYEIYDTQIPDYIAIDWKRTARNVMVDYLEMNGHYFRVL